MKQSPIDQPLFDPVQILLLRDALGEEDLCAMLSEFPGAAGGAYHKISAALQSNNLEEVRRLAHAFKGVAGSFGAARLAAIAVELELEATSIASIVQRMPALADAIDQTLAALPGVERAPLGATA
jgi:HPt (histidine-containing phosphotransfer) domain-containing protein